MVLTDGVHERFVVVPASYLVLRRGAEVLLQLRAGTGFRDGFWAVGAAGHVELGESALTACVREAREELGIELVPADVHPLTTLHRREPPDAQVGGTLDERVDFFFTASQWGGQPRIMEPHKSAELRWCGLDSLPDPVVPHELDVLTALRLAERSGTAVPAIMTSGW